MTIQLQDLKSTFTLDTKGMTSGAKVALAGVSALVAGVTTAAVFIKKAVDVTIKWADGLDALQDVTDLTNDQVAGLNYLLRKHGVDAGTASKSLTILNKNLIDYKGNLASSGKVLQSYGIDVRNSTGELKNNADLLQEISNKYAMLPAGAERASFATDVFGKSGADLNDVLIEMADRGLGGFIDKAKQLGLNIDADKVQKYKQSVEEMKLSWEALQISVGSKVIPVLEKVSNWFTNVLQSPQVKNALDTVEGWLVDGVDWKEVSTFLSEGIDSIDWAKVGDSVSRGVGTIIQGVGTFLKEFDWLKFGNSLASAANNLFFGLFGETEATAQKIIKTTLNQIAIDIENWINKVKAYLAGLGLIKTSFTMTTLPKFDMSHPATGNTGYTPNGVQAGNYTYQNGQYILNRASGGATTAGQAYNVTEFNKPETFTPAVNGRISPTISSEQILGALRELLNKTPDKHDIASAVRDAVLLGMAA